MSPVNISKLGQHNHLKIEANSFHNSLLPANNPKTAKWATFSAVTSPISARKKKKRARYRNWRRRAKNDGLVPAELFPTKEVEFPTKEDEFPTKEVKCPTKEDKFPTKEVKFPTKEVRSTPSPEGNRLLPIRGIMEGIENNMVCKKCSCSKLSLTMSDCQNDLKAQLCKDNELDNNKIKEEIDRIFYRHFRRFD